MFTVEQIEEAHNKVKSGAGFPAYIQEIKELGVSHYGCYINDGHIDYYGAENYTVKASSKHSILTIAETTNSEKFKADLKAHQQGKTDYPTFCNDCAKSGIEKWIVCMDKMTCTYFDKAGKEILAEVIPQ